MARPAESRPKTLFIETSGLADPCVFLRALAAVGDEEDAPVRLCLRKVVLVLDAVSAAGLLATPTPQGLTNHLQVPVFETTV